MKISLVLDPSKYWWAYLGIRSNPGLLSPAADPIRHAIFFDHPSQIHTFLATAEQPAHYFFIYWDGINDHTAIDNARALLGAGARLTVLVVGDSSSSRATGDGIQLLYPDGPLAFASTPLPFDMRTSRILLIAKVKAFLMPLKNLLQRKAQVGEMVNLLFGERRIVFCGSYGTSPAALQQLCQRHAADFQIFNDYPYYSKEPSPSLEAFRTTLQRDAVFLARLYDSAQINAQLFLSATSLLGREYFIEKIRAAGMPFFFNGYTTGININVYTTPFYRQHVFPDFGSVAGTGNYPRLADLRYFKKHVVEIAPTGNPEELITLARQGQIEEHFEREWQLRLPELMRYFAQT